jgi:Domain of unknown function (DUF4412)
MKTPSLLLTVAGVLAFSSVVCADYEIKISSRAAVTNEPKELTMKVKGSKVRTDLPSGKHLISDTQANTRFVVDDQKKQVTDMSGMLGAVHGKNDQPPTKALATGRKEKFNGYEVEEYTYSVASGLKIAVWVAPEYPKDKGEALRALSKGNPANAMGGTPDLSTLPGPVIRTVVTDGAGMSSQTEVKSVTEVTLEDKEFEIPTDYKARKFNVPAGLQEPGKGK